MPFPLRQPADSTALLTGAVCAVFAITAAGAVLAPGLFWLPPAVAASAAIAVLVYRNTVAFCVAWLLIAGATLEMTLADLIGPAAWPATIAAVKAAGMVLALVCILRYGASPDVFNPGFAFLAMFLVGLVHGLHPDLTMGGSLRSLAGSVAPFAFAFSRLSRDWSRAMIRMTAWIPLLTVGAGAVLDLAGLRPLFIDLGGQRLGALGHPAFLAGFCLTAIYACLIELYREGQSRWVALMAANFAILALTGARTPLACAVLVTAVTLAFLRSPTATRNRRMLLLLSASCLLPLIAALASDLPVLRLFNVMANEALNLSGRELLWAYFNEAAAASPWFGWGIGAGNAIIPSDSELALLMQTYAAHNEYLRMEVEGGQIGRGVLIAMILLWVTWHTGRLCRTDKVIMRLVFVAFAANAYVDNLLIATSACVFFAFATAVFARGTRERESLPHAVRKA